MDVRLRDSDIIVVQKAEWACRIEGREISTGELLEDPSHNISGSAVHYCAQARVGRRVFSAWQAKVAII